MEIYLGILAGGQSRRFGSNKALFTLENQPLLLHIIQEIPFIDPTPSGIYLSLHDKAQLDEITPILQESPILQQKNPQEWSVFAPDESMVMPISLTIVFDSNLRPLRNLRTPLLGMQSIFQNISSGYVQFIPCDMPYFNAEIIKTIFLFTQSLPDSWDALIPRWDNGQLEPLNGIYQAQSFLPIIKENLINQQLRIINLFQPQLNVQWFPIESQLRSFDPDFKSFTHYNENNGES